MQIIKVELHVKPIFKSIAEVTRGGAVIGYLSPSEDDEYPVAATLPNGENFGTFDCARCACTKLDMKASDIDERDVVDINPSRLLASLLLASLVKHHAF